MALLATGHFASSDIWLSFIGTVRGSVGIDVSASKSIKDIALIAKGRIVEHWPNVQAKRARMVGLCVLFVA